VQVKDRSHLMGSDNDAVLPRFSGIKIFLYPPADFFFCFFSRYPWLRAILGIIMGYRLNSHAMQQYRPACAYTSESRTGGVGCTRS